MANPRRWTVAAGTTLQELDRLLRERLAADGLAVGLTITVAHPAAPRFRVSVGRASVESQFLSSAIDQALEIIDAQRRSAA